MKGMLGGVALGMAVSALAVLPAHASVARSASSASDVQFAYDPPQISDDGTHVTWRWTMQNRGTDEAAHVTLLHKLDPSLNGIKASAPCEITTAKAVRCRWESVPGGGTEQGTIEADLPANMSGTVQISGRITWQQGPSTPKAEDASGRVPGEPAAADHS